MARTLRLVAGALALPLLLAGCNAKTDGPAAADPVPVAFRIDLSGETGPLLAADGTIRLALAREGAEGAVTLAFENGALAVHPLAPGRYAVTSLGPLRCRGLAFEVGAAPRHLGTLEARVVRTDYLVALMRPAVAAAADVAALAESAGAAAGAVDARPLPVAEPAPCFLGRDGPVTTWEDLTFGEKILLGAGVAGLCAVALAAGGFCMF